MFSKLCLEGATNWATIMPNNRILMVVPIKKAIKDTLMRLGKIISNPDRDNKGILTCINGDNDPSESISFSNGSVIYVVTEESIDPIGPSFDTIYVHPWCESDGEDFEPVLAEGGMIF